MISTERFSVGLTGGIGSGKSTVANMFAARGAAIIDTDLIAHQLCAREGRQSPLSARDSALPSLLLRRDGPGQDARTMYLPIPAAKKQLESILHPLIRAETERAAQQAQGNYDIRGAAAGRVGRLDTARNARAGNRLPRIAANPARDGTQWSERNTSACDHAATGFTCRPAGSGR